MALHDKEVYRTLGCGMSGLSIAADSLSAVKYAKVYPIYNKDAKNLEGHEYEYVEGADDDLIVGYRTEGDFPIYGNDDDRADDIAKWVGSTVMGQVKRLPVYRGAVPTQSILTITSNVEYGKNTVPSRPATRRARRTRRAPTRRTAWTRTACCRPCSPSARSITTTLLTASR